MKIKYTCTHWGSEHLDAETFIDKIKLNGYDGVEINLPEQGTFLNEFLSELDDSFEKNPNFIFIPQQLITPENETVDEFIKRMEKNLLRLISYHPSYIHSHTGTDFFTFEDNCRIIDACMNLSAKTGIRILHETHRGRFSFHAATLLPYLVKFPELELVGDFSHFCVVSESLLHNQHDILKQIIPHVSHIHARIGYSQGPQVNDPFAPEWSSHISVFDGWWNEIINLKKEKGWSEFVITPEFGPAPYMPAMPFTLQPLGNQWEINFKMKDHLINLFNK